MSAKGNTTNDSNIVNALISNTKEHSPVDIHTKTKTHPNHEDKKFIETQTEGNEEHYRE